MGILIIEDEKKVADFIRRGLEAESHTVEVCYDGEEGFRKIRENSYSLIILDVVLPLKDGLSIVRDLRAAKITTPVLILTARSSVDDIVAGLDAGSDDYLAKPFALVELLARVRALLRRSGQDRGVAEGQRGKAYAQGIFPPRIFHAQSRPAVDPGDHCR
jgi:DNA-binding response OmpR family regulator